MGRMLFIFIIILLTAICAPARVEAFSGAKAAKAAGQGVTWTAKSAGKAIYWAGKGMYKVAEYLVVEMLRPIKAITDKATDIWGVPVEE